MLPPGGAWAAPGGLGAEPTGGPVVEVAELLPPGGAPHLLVEGAEGHDLDAALPRRLGPRRKVARVELPEKPRCRQRGSRRLLWAEALRRVFGLDLLTCPRCGHQRKPIALIEQPGVARWLLDHLVLDPDVPILSPVRPPPTVAATIRSS